ncbi:MAG: hypothetical protein K5751_08755 [Treponemataceae bacterium]|nr:hypothetical protein [Treponemataceae bacterium]
MNNCFVFRRAFRHSFFAVVPLLFLAILFSCNNVITDNTKNTPTVQPNNGKTVTITGYVRNPYAESGNSRAAFPSASFSDTRYSVTATTTDVSGEVTGDADNI